jgi:hypothetical protein
MAKGRRRYPNIPNKKQVLVPQNTPPSFSALTNKYTGITNRIQTPVKISEAFDPDDFKGNIPPVKIIDKNALWDTGATNSVITSQTAKELNLPPIGSVIVNHAGGSSQATTYLVNLVLPNQVGFKGVQVSECPDSEFGVIIGMDIICTGDFSITNLNNQTIMSFRHPSISTIDYVEESNNLNKANKK